MKATLWCSRYDRRVTVATSTTPGLILPILGWALARRMVMSHFDPFCPRRCTQSIKVQWSAPRLAPHQPVDYYYTSVVRHTNYFSYRRMR